MWNFLAIITLVPLTIILLFTVLVLPIWCLFNCIASKDISNKFKAVWILIVVLLWSLGSVIYGSFVTRSSLLKLLSRICLGFVIVLFASFISWAPVFSTGQATKFLTKLDGIEYIDLSADEIHKLKSCIHTLRDEFDENRLSSGNFRKRFQLLTIIQTLVKDNKLTKAEYAEWIILFDARAYLDSNELAKHQMRLKSGFWSLL